MLKTIRFWLLAAFAILFAGHVRAEVHYDERIETFEVGAREGTPDEIWRGIRRWGPTGGDMHARSTIVGQAAGKVRWQWALSSTGGSCRVAQRDVYVSVTIRLPDWRYRAFASSEQKAYWDCIEGIVTEHENRHAEIWRETGGEIDRALGRLTASSCSELRTVLDATTQRLYAEGRDRQHTFDADDAKLRRFDRCETLVVPKAATDSRSRTRAATPTPPAERVAVAHVDAANTHGSRDTSFWLMATGAVVCSALSIVALVWTLRG